MSQKTIALAITGASGIQYAVRLIDQLLTRNQRVYLMVSKAAQIVAGMETDQDLSGRPREIAAKLGKQFDASENQLTAFGEEEWTSPLASGSGVADAMVVCPCSMGALSAIATGASNNLIERAADVTLKERRRLILVPRETPFSDIHLENMLKLSRMGVVILPPNPGFYHKHETVENLVDFVVARILDQLDIEHDLFPAWGE